MVAELMTKDAEGAGRVAEALGHLRRGILLDEEGAQSLVLALERELGGNKEALIGRRCYLITSTDWHDHIMPKKQLSTTMFNIKWLEGRLQGVNNYEMAMRYLKASQRSRADTFRFGIITMITISTVYT